MDAYNPRETEKRSEYEQELSTLLTTTCEQIYPTSGFSIYLDGIHPTQRVKNEIDAFIGYELSPTDGATITLNYNIETDNLELQSLSQPLRDIPNATFSIQRTLDSREELRYIPLIEVGNEAFNLNRSSLGRTLNNSLLESFISGYHLSDIPHPTHESYQLWRANLLAYCEEGWQIKEQMTLLTGVSEQTEETIAVTREMHYKDSENALSREEINHTNTFSSQESTTTQSVSTVLAEEADSYGRVIHAHRHIKSEDFDPFVRNYSIITSESLKDIPLDSTITSRFTQIGNTVQSIVRSRA